MKKNLLIIFLFILSLALIGYISYDKVINVATKTKEPIQTKTKEEYKPELTKGQVDYYLSVVPLGLENTENLKDAYIGSKTYIKDIDEETKYGKAYENTYETEERPSVSDAHKDLKEMMGDTSEENYYNGVVKASDMEKTINNMYNISLNNVDKFEYPGGMIYKSGNYYSVYYGRGAEGIDKVSYNNSYEYKNNDLIIKEKAIFIFEEMGEEQPEQIYTTTSQTEKIGQETYEDSTNKYYMIDKYKDKFTSFKHTFKRNKNGSFYWYSTEVE